MQIINRIPFKAAALAILTFLTLILFFHIFVLLGVIPYSIVWGGRLESVTQMRVFEIVSIVLNSVIIATVSMKSGYLQPVVSVKTLNFILWLLVVLFTLNTIGNLFSTSTLETIVFTPLTLIGAVLCYRLAIEKPQMNA